MADLVLNIRVRPQARQTKITSTLADGSIKIALAAPAEDGKANAELIRFLAEEYGVDRQKIEIVTGQTNRRKTIRIQR